MPAVPGTHLILVHAHFTLASLETRLNAGARLDDPRQFRKRGLFACHGCPMCRRKIVMIAVAGVVIGGIPRGPSLQRALVRQRTTGDHQPFCGSGAFALHPRLHSACDHLDGHRTLLTISHRESPPGAGIERLAPRCHRLPWGFWPPTASLIRLWQRFQVAYRRGAGHPQYIPLATFTQLLAKSRVATELIITGDPAMWDVHAPCVEHLQALSLAGLVTHLWRDVACVAPLLVVCPLPRQGQPEVEQRMVVFRDIAHEDTDLAVVNFAPV